MEPKKPKKEKTPTKVITPEALKEIINEIVEQLGRQAESREAVTEIVKEAKSEYGLNPTNLRKAARIYFMQNINKYKTEVEEIDEILQTTGLLK